jgi:hypothetical protein
MPEFTHPFVAYVPPGISIDVVNTQLNQIEENVRLFAPTARLEQKIILNA